MSDFTGSRWAVQFWFRWARFCAWSMRHLLYRCGLLKWLISGFRTFFISAGAKWSKIRKFGFLVAGVMNIICQVFKFLTELHFMMKNWKFNYGNILALRLIFLLFCIFICMTTNCTCSSVLLISFSFRLYIVRIEYIYINNLFLGRLVEWYFFKGAIGQTLKMWINQVFP